MNEQERIEALNEWAKKCRKKLPVGLNKSDIDSIRVAINAAQDVIHYFRTGEMPRYLEERFGEGPKFKSGYDPGRDLNDALIEHWKDILARLELAENQYPDPPKGLWE